MFKNTASQSATLMAFDASTGLQKTGDSANMVFYVSKDDGTVTAIAASSGVPTEVDSTNAKGLYKIALSQAETNADKLLFSGKSSTSNIVVVPAVLYTLPANFTSFVTPTNLTAAQIATGIWQDTTAGDFTVASSIGKSLFTSGNVPGAASGLAIVGSAMGDSSGVATLLSRIGGAITITSGGVLVHSVDTGGIVTASFAAGTTIPRVTLADTVTTNTDMLTVASILTTQMTEAYAANGAAPTLAQALFLIQQTLTEFAISGTTITVKKKDHSTTAATLTLNDATTPTSATRAT